MKATDYTMDPRNALAVRFLQSFRAGEDWRGTHSWRRLDL